MTTDPNDRPSRVGPTDAIEAFRRGRRDADELAAVARRATDLLHTRAPDTFGRLSALLEWVLPTHPARLARVARAIDSDLETLERLRKRQLDPLRAPRPVVAALWPALRIDREAFKRLVAADHASFAGQLTTGFAARGARETEADAWAALDAALDRVALDSPARAGDE